MIGVITIFLFVSTSNASLLLDVIRSKSSVELETTINHDKQVLALKSGCSENSGLGTLEKCFLLLELKKKLGRVSEVDARKQEAELMKRCNQIREVSEASSASIDKLPHECARHILELMEIRAYKMTGIFGLEFEIAYVWLKKNIRYPDTIRSQKWWVRA